MDKDIFMNNCYTTYLKVKSWKTFRVANELYSQHKEADHKILPRQYLKVKREIKHLLWLMILTFLSCYCGRPVHSNPMCSFDKENYLTKREFYTLKFILWQNS